jgi:SecY interacting protein Syd
MSSIQLALSQLFAEALLLTDQGYFLAEYDPDWRSPCELPSGTDALINREAIVPDSIPWKPVTQEPKVDFSGLENALETTIHPDLVTYFSSYWSGTIETKSLEGHTSLIQLWNPEDFDRLIENYIGHSLAKRRIKESLTFFFATTEPDSEYFLSIDNATGAVLLEEPGRSPIKQVDDNLFNFLQRLTPVNSVPEIF